MNDLLQKLMYGASTAAMAAAMPMTAAYAQYASDTNIEQVVVSASRITIAGYSQPTPVTVIGSAQLQQEAYDNIADAVRELPQVLAPESSYGVNQGGTSGTNGGNFINLRDLGIARTLVLFDGQRVVNSSFASGAGVDVNMLPSTLISRVDVVTGGASAAWGSDAVAGVVNFIIDKNYSGFKATVQGSDTANNRYRGLGISAAMGDDVFGGRGHFEVAVDAKISPDAVLLSDENWFKNTYWVSNPAYAAGNGQPQLIVASNVGSAQATPGGLITSSPKGTSAAANALRGIEFVGAGNPQLVNFGNITNGSISNGGSLTQTDSFASWQEIASPISTYTAFAYGRYKLTDNIQASVQLNYGYSTGKSNAGSDLQTSLVIQSDNAYIPASVRAAMQAGGIPSFTMGTFNGNNYNNSTATGANESAQAEGALAPATSFNRRQLMRAVFTLDGSLGDDWSWNAYVQHSAVRASVHLLGDALVSNLTAAEDAVTVTAANVGKSGAPLGSIACRTTLNGTPVTINGFTAQAGCIPLDVFGNGVASPAAIAYITGATTNSMDYQDQSLQQDVAEGSMQGTLPWALPAGKVAIAFGAGYRREQGRVQAPAITAIAAYAQANNYSPAAPSQYNVLEGFGEVDAPILKDNIVNSLDFNAAGRVTSYSTSGLVETWKLGATSQVNDDIKLRTTWSVDIRAPQLGDLFSAVNVSTPVDQDPKTQALVQVIAETAGNPNLKPEVARTISGGVVLTPTFIPGLSLSADWYSIHVTNEITTLSQPTIINQCNPNIPSAIHPGQNGNINDPLCSFLVFNGPNGALSQINLQEINFASQTTSGLDLQANYNMDFWDGTLAWTALANLNDENTLSSPGVGVNDIAGSNDLIQSGFLAGPKWKGVLSTNYIAGPYSFTVQGRWYGTSVTQQGGDTGNHATAATANLYDPAHYEMPFTAYLDLRGNYKWNDNISFYGAVDNTTNVPPPLNPNATALTLGNPYLSDTNNSVYDLMGRTFRVGVRFNY